MRQIKFRAWNNANKYFAPLEDDGDYYFRDDGDGLTLYDKWGECKDTILIQYTGRNDKNLKEIYEGDILKTPEGHIIKIEFGEKLYRFKGKFRTDEIQCFGWLAHKVSNGHIETLDDSMTTGEIIGNIYENPELLK